jgi:1-acyl-sn-glycerol-3-phosphate acyltransferase
MMPEARLSTAGKFEDIQPTTHKFFKKMGVPIYTIKISGGYFAMPKWGDAWRKKSTVEIALDKLVDEQEIKTITEQDLKEKIEVAMQYNEFEWLKTHPELSYNHKTLAKGLDNILYICPKCKKKHTIVSGDKYLVCNHCGLRADLDNRYSFVNSFPFENFQAWYDYQQEQLRLEIEGNENYLLESKVELKLPSKDGKTFMRKAGYGVCKLDRKGLTYNGTLDGQQIEKTFSIETIYRLLFGAGEDFEVYENKTLYYFVPENKKTCVLWYNASEILKDLSLKKDN